MKAFVLDKLGEPETLRLADIPPPVPKAGEARVRVEAVALNPVDYKMCGRGHPLWTFPFVPGVDVAGTIDAVAADVTQWKPGDRVYYHGDMRKPGGFAEFAIADQRALARIADRVTSIQAAALPTAAFTAYQAIFCKAMVRKGSTVLIHGGSGGVGGFALQFARGSGLFKTILTTASPKNTAFVKKLGADHVIDYHGDVKAEVLRLTGNRGLDMIVDTVSPENAAQGLELLAFGGHLVFIVGQPDFSGWHLFRKALSLHEIALGMVYASEDDEAIRGLGKIGEAVMDMLAHNKLDALVGEVAPFADLPQALRRLKSREVPAGKVVVKVRE